MSNGCMAMVWVCLTVCSGSALALDFIGPPVSELEKGQWALSGTYSDSEVDFEINEGLEGSRSISGWKFRDVESRKLYPSFHYGWTENIDLIFSVGVVETNMGDRYTESTDSYVEFGFKTTLLKKERWSFGIAGQGSWSRSHFKEFNQLDGLYGSSYSEPFTLDLWEFLFAAGPSCYVTDQLNFYGGPFVHFIDGRMKFDDLPAGLISLNPLIEGTYDVDEISVWGGFVGAQYELSDNLLLSAEYQATQSNDGAAIRLMWLF